MPRLASWVRISSILTSCLMFAAFDCRVILLPTLEKQLAAARHEAEVARLRETISVEDHERAMVVGIWLGAGVGLAAMQLRTEMDLRRATPGFRDHVGQEERTELVGDFITAATVVATVNMEDVLRGAGQGP